MTSPPTSGCSGGWWRWEPPGRASGKGFYARDGSQRLAVDLETLEYRPAQKPRLDAVAAARKSGLPALVATADRYGDYAETVLTKVLDYASGMVPEVTDQPALIDLAMERGFNWKRGPFGMIEQLGGPAAPPPVRRPGVVLLSDLRARPALESSSSATLWDAGDEVACLEFHTKANAIDDGVLELIERTVAAAGERFRALVIYNEGAFFSTGGNLAHLLTMANVAAWDRVHRFGERGQRAFDGLKFAPVPVIGAPTGRALGGGCEGAPALRRGAGPHRDIHGAGRAGGGAAAGLGRLPRAPDPRHRDLAGRADAAGRQGVRGDRQRQGLDFRPQRQRAGLPAGERPDHRQPRPAAGRRQGVRAGAGR